MTQFSETNQKYFGTLIFLLGGFLQSSIMILVSVIIFKSIHKCSTEFLISNIIGLQLGLR